MSVPVIYIFTCFIFNFRIISTFLDSILYNGLAFLNSSSLHERSDKRLLIISGRYFIIIGEAEVHVDHDYKIYYGAVEGDFKFRCNNHTNSFRNRCYEHATELSKYIWKLKDLGKAFILKWSIAAYASPYRCGTRRCDLCITEKYIIARAGQKRLLNKRTEFISKCRHRNKFLLKNVK